MNGRQRIEATLRGGLTDRIALCPHWYGAYKYEFAGLVSTHDEAERVRLYGADLAAVDSAFYRRFHPDWIQLSTPPWARVPERFHSAEYSRLRAAVRSCSSPADIEDYVAFTTLTDEEKKATRVYEHVPLILSQFGNEAYVVMNEGNPVNDIFDPHGLLGFEQGLTALLSSPDFVARLVWRLYEQRLDWVRYLAATGVHGYFSSETYCGADLMAPDTWRALIAPAQRMFYRRVRELGLEPLCYFCGNANPIIADLADLGVSAIQFEESKKSFTLDICRLRQKLDQRVVLLGNLDSVGVLLQGTPEEVRRETRRQLVAARYGPFIMSNGSPIPLHTPPENLDAMREQVEKWSAEGRTNQSG